MLEIEKFDADAAVLNRKLFRQTNIFAGHWRFYVYFR